RLAGAALLPFAGVSPWIGTALLVIGVVCVLRVRRTLPAGHAIRAELGRRLAVAAAGAAVAVAAWAVYVPAPDHCSPSAAGTVNRVHALAAIGIALLAHSFLM